MTAPTVYRWDDVDAPILSLSSTDTTAFVQLMKACLVNGYGDKLPPGNGYSLEFENVEGTSIALKSKSPDSNGFYYNICTESVYTSNAAAYHLMVIDMADNMIDAVTRINPTYNSRIVGAGPYGGAIPWVIVADDRFFYVFNFTNHLLSGSPIIKDMSSTSNCCVGDFVTVQNDPWSSLVWGYTYYYDHYRYFERGDFGFGRLVDSGHATPRAKVKRNFDGDSIAVDFCLSHGGGPLPSDVGIMGGLHDNVDTTHGGVAPYGDALPIIISRPMIQDISPWWNFRGWIPGLYYPCHLKPYSNLEQVTVGSKTFLAVNFSYYFSDYGQVLIDLGDWWV